MTLAERVSEAGRRLKAAGIDARDAAFDAEVLARRALGWDRATYLARWREPAPHAFAERFERLVARRFRREPVARIIGRREFWGLDIEVTPAVSSPGRSRSCWSRRPWPGSGTGPRGGSSPTSGPGRDASRSPSPASCPTPG
jgi:methylase of polypeptide subunit release factors